MYALAGSRTCQSEDIFMDKENEKKKYLLKINVDFCWLRKIAYVTIMCIA